MPELTKEQLVYAYEYGKGRGLSFAENVWSEYDSPVCEELFLEDVYECETNDHQSASFIGNAREYMSINVDDYTKQEQLDFAWEYDEVALWDNFDEGVADGVEEVRAKIFDE